MLKPTISWDAKLSPETKLMVPFKDFLSPFMVNWYPPSLRNKYEPQDARMADVYDGCHDGGGLGGGCRRKAQKILKRLSPKDKVDNFFYYYLS